MYIVGLMADQQPLTRCPTVEGCRCALRGVVLSIADQVAGCERNELCADGALEYVAPVTMLRVMQRQEVSDKRYLLK